MQRRRPRLLSARQNEIEPLDLASPASKHRHESRAANLIAQSASHKQKTAVLTLVDLFCNLKIHLAVLNTAMSPALKACARGVLTFLQIVIVVAFVVSPAVIAALGCLEARKRSRACEIPNVLFDRFRDHAA